MDDKTNEIVAMFEQYGADWVKIGPMVGMTANAARNRYWRWKNGGSRHKWRRPTQETVSNSDDNHMVVSNMSNRVKSLDDMLKECKVNLTVWRVDRYRINKWEMGRKKKTVELTIAQGVMDGSVNDTGKIEIEPLFQVEVWLVRRKLEPIELVIRPLVIPRILASKAKRVKAGAVQRALLIPDIQFGYKRSLENALLDPFHDRAALDVVLQVAEDHEFDRIVILGDILDLPEWQDKFVVSPDFYNTTQPALIEAAWWLAQFRHVKPKAQIDAVEGNHDFRIKNAIAVHLRASYHLRAADEMNMPPAMSIPKLLGLASLGIGWIGGYPDACVWLTDNLMCVHGDKARSDDGATSRAMVKNAPVSRVFAHIHKIEQAVHTMYSRREKIFVSMTSVGCLCKIDGSVPGHTLSQNWQQGFGVATYGDGFHWVEPCMIHDGRAVYGGKVYRARDHVKELQKVSSGWRFM